MTTDTGFTPSELELMIRTELRKTKPVPETLLVRIIRQDVSWRAEASFKNGHGLIGGLKSEWEARVSAVGDELAATHRIVG